MTLSAGTAAAVLANAMAASAVPSALAEATLRTAGLFAAGLASTHVATLTKEVLRAMFTTRLKKAAALVLAAGVLATALGVYFFRTRSGGGRGRHSKQAGPPRPRRQRTSRRPISPPITPQVQGTWTLVAAEAGGQEGHTG